jgi:hypothetical protein
MGPDTGVAAEIRYFHVGQYNGMYFDLVVTSLSSVELYDGQTGGCHGMFGKILNRAWSSLDLKFAFEDSNTGAPVTLPKFVFTVFDLDGDGNERL